MTPECDLAYCAGIIDGEGTVCAIMKNGGVGVRVGVAVLMTDRIALDVLAATLGGRVVQTKRRTVSGKVMYS